MIGSFWHQLHANCVALQPRSDYVKGKVEFWGANFSNIAWQANWVDLVRSPLASLFVSVVLMSHLLV